MSFAAKRYSAPFLVAVFAISAAAYDHPLESSSIRDAYFLGADNHESAEFLSRYVKTLAATQSGPYISQIEVRTPFAEVVDTSRERTVGYSALQAEEDYHKNAGTVQVRVQILVGSPLGVSNVAQQPAACQGVNRMNSALDCFHDFRFHFSQQNQEKDKPVHPQSSYGVPIYAIGDGSIFTGGDVWFTFRASQIDSAPLHVSATRRDGQKFSADFDLASLR